MGNNLSINKINFEDMKYMQNDNNCIIINTMDSNKQNCLIKGHYLSMTKKNIK